MCVPWASESQLSSSSKDRTLTRGSEKKNIFSKTFFPLPQPGLNPPPPLPPCSPCEDIFPPSTRTRSKLARAFGSVCQAWSPSLTSLTVYLGVFCYFVFLKRNFHCRNSKSVPTDFDSRGQKFYGFIFL